MRRLLRLASSSLLALSVCSLASAQDGFRLDRLQLPPTIEDGLVLQLPSTLGHLRSGFRLQLGYAHLPLQTSDRTGSVDVVRHQLAADLAFALGLGSRTELFVSLPTTLYQTGDNTMVPLNLEEPAKAGLGDLRMGASVRLYGEKKGFSIGARASLFAPTGSQKALASNGAVGAEGALMLAYAFSRALLAGELGGMYRPHHKGALVETGPELPFRAGVHVPVGTRTRLLAELDGSARFVDGKLFEKHSVPLEALLGARFAVGGGVLAGVTGGLGLTDAPGVPAYRALMMLGWAAPVRTEKPTPKPIPMQDAGRDGFSDDRDACPFEPGPLDGCPVQEPPPPPARESEPVREVELPAPAALAPATLTEPVTFEYNSGEIDFPRYGQLHELRRLMLQEPSLRVRLVGHASDHDREQDFSARQRSRRNQQLSETRAKAVKRWLARRGIERSRIDTEGRGASEPAAANDSEESRARNRRVEAYKADR